MSQLSTNTISLQEILEAVNNLPDAGGVELPELSNPATASEIFLGEEVINRKGNKMTGTFTIENEISELNTLIPQLRDTIDELPNANNGNTSELKIAYIYNNSTSYTPEIVHVIIFEEGATWGDFIISKYNTQVLQNGTISTAVNIYSYNPSYVELTAKPYRILVKPSSIGTGRVLVSDQIIEGAIYPIYNDD